MWINEANLNAQLAQAYEVGYRDARFAMGNELRMIRPVKNPYNNMMFRTNIEEASTPKQHRKPSWRDFDWMGWLR